MGSDPVAVTAVIAAAGSGQRLGAGGPKAFVPLAGKPMVEWSVEAFAAAESVGSIVIACPPGHAHAGGGEGVTVVDGGETRAESVANALAAVEAELVAIHDAARPLVTPELIEGVVATLAADTDAAGAIAATPVTDTIKQVARGIEQVGAEEAPPGATNPPLSIYEMKKGGLVVESTLDRARLWAAQTPQVFRAEALREAIAAASDPSAATDEAMLVEATGGRVLIHPAPPENLKVTTPADLRLAELLLAERQAS
jgi:2-C-methyl-D-erythritol 4-phosphate cytidylyltransferase